MFWRSCCLRSPEPCPRCYCPPPLLLQLMLMPMSATAITL
jgi:hypothetical protein